MFYARGATTSANPPTPLKTPFLEFPKSRFGEVLPKGQATRTCKAASRDAALLHTIGSFLLNVELCLGNEKCA